MRRLFMAFGLALLYAAAYYLPLLSPQALYYSPSLYRVVLFPPLVSVLVLTPLFWFCGSRMAPAGVRVPAIFAGTVILTLIALKSVFDAAGYPWFTALLAVFKDDPAHALERARLARRVILATLVPATILLVFLIRHKLQRYLHFLAILGYVFVLLGLYRCMGGQLDVHFGEPTAPLLTARADHATVVPRRVVWVIFDEMDYRIAFGAGHPPLPNFARLAARGVSATDAYSPGRDTLFSLPALLTGSAIEGFAIDHARTLTLTRRGGEKVPFDTAHSIFSRLPGGPAGATLLGFYHPYCRVVPNLRGCQSSMLSNTGRWFDSLLYFGDMVLGACNFLKLPPARIPEALLTAFEPMYRASKASIDKLDAVVGDTGSTLSFIHLNFPHLPAPYADRLLPPAAVNEVDAYRHNLLFADKVLGKIVTRLEAQARVQNILLIVSSDHWLRTGATGASPVPFIVWQPGADVAQARQMTRPLSTYHSADLALGFLDGSIASQAAAADFLEHQAFVPTWIPPTNEHE